jgi:hypothetical protein
LGTVTVNPVSVEGGNPVTLNVSLNGTVSTISLLSDNWYCGGPAQSSVPVPAGAKNVTAIVNTFKVTLPCLFHITVFAGQNSMPVPITVTPPPVVVTPTPPPVVVAPTPTPTSPQTFTQSVIVRWARETAFPSILSPSSLTVSSASWTLRATPVNPVMVFRNGVLLTPPGDYSISGPVITFNTSQLPVQGDTYTATYEF